MPRHAGRIKIRRKDLRKPDEFETLTGQAVAWADEHRPVVYAVLAVAVVVLAGSLAIGRWRASRNDAAAVAFGSAQARFDEGKFQDAAQDFAYVVERYPGAPFARLAALYRAHATPRRRPSSRRRSPAQRDPRAAPPKVRPTAIPSARRGPASSWHADGADVPRRPPETPHPAPASTNALMAQYLTAFGEWPGATRTSAARVACGTWRASHVPRAPRSSAT